MNNPHFKTRARILCQLGEQLIKNEGIALLELIKNAYDADASLCDVVMSNPTSPENGSIVIQDDGIGMNYDTIVNVWLEIGTDHKANLEPGKSAKRTSKFKRICLGEKGIGRLGVHRLGREIELISHAKDSDEVVLKIDWDKAVSSKMIEDIPLEISTRPPTTFSSDQTGTIIKITRLRMPWSRKIVRDCYRTISALNSPFEANDSFNALFSIKGSKAEEAWLDGLLSFNDVKEWKLFSFDITMSGTSIQRFHYEFSPWPTMPKLSPRIVDWGNENVLSRLIRKKKDDNLDNSEDIDLGEPDIGSIRFQGVIFDRDAKTLSLGVQDKAGLKEYLDINGGVRVFRDNMRVLDYGEPGNDWLDLNSRRVNRPGVHISNNVIMAAVYLDRESSTNLVEKANREGFIENSAYHNLYSALGICLQRVEMERRADKDILRKACGVEETSEPVVSSVAELRDTIEKAVKDPKAKDKIYHYLTRIEDEYATISESLIRSAGAGLNLIMVIHQMDKILKNVQAIIKQKGSNREVENQVHDLAALVEGYSILVKNSEKKERNLKGIVEKSIFNIDFRLQSHNVSLEAAYKDRKKNTDAICAENHVMNALLNIFDNSIWWLNYARRQFPSIFLDISDAFPGHISIVIADNGPGFTKATSEIIKPFVSDKPEGMGIGLHLTDEIMKSLKGQLMFPGLEIFDIPDKYSRGAIVALAFPKKEN